MSKKNIKPEVVKAIEDALEERKTPSDRRQGEDPNHPHADPAKDRRSGKDRRNKD